MVEIARNIQKDDVIRLRGKNFRVFRSEFSFNVNQEPGYDLFVVHDQEKIKLRVDYDHPFKIVHLEPRN